MTQHETKIAKDEALEQRLDALLKQKTLVAPAGFADRLLQNIKRTDTEFDAILDERLAARLPERCVGRTEVFFQGVLRHARIRNVVRWTLPAFAASVAVLLALTMLVYRGNLVGDLFFGDNWEDRIVQRAVDADPALAAMLQDDWDAKDASTERDATTNVGVIAADIVEDTSSDFNEDAIAWLEILTLPDEETALM